MCPITSGVDDMSVQPPVRKLCVLVVDDDRDTADSCHLIFSIWGRPALVAYGAKAALATALRERPNVVLLDLGLPQMCGLELPRRLRAEPGLGGLLLVAVTGYGR